MGQCGLLLAELDLRATSDLDALISARKDVTLALETILKKHGLRLDLLGKEIWIPEETEYSGVYAGDYLGVSRADVAYILISKAKMAPEKNSRLIAEYIASDLADNKFFEMAAKYSIDLEGILKNGCK